MRLGPKLIALFFLVVFIPLVFAEISSTNYKITSYAVDSGGSNITSTNYKTDFSLGSIAKAIVGTLYKLFLGFFYTVVDSVAPTITVIAPLNNSNFNISTVNFNVSLNDIGSGCRLSISGGANVSMSPNPSYEEFNYTNSSMDDGYHTFIFYCNDTSNNYGVTGTYTLLIDTINPIITYINPSPRDTGAVNSTEVTLNVSVSDASSSTTYSFFDDGLVLWMRMDDTNQSEEGAIVYDISGYGNNATSAGNAVQVQNGMFGEGFDFDGVGDYVNITVSQKKNSTSLWYKNSTDLYWTYVAYNGTRYFVNGAPGAPAKYPLNISGNNVKIGVNNSNYFNGSIDEVTIFNRSLSAAEIQALYNSSQYTLQRELTGLTEQSHTYTAQAVDQGGSRNQSTITFDVDLTYPGINFTNPTPANNTITANNFLLINVSTTDTATNISTFIDFDNSLVSWWRFDEGNGSIDYMGRNDGVINGDARQVEAGYFGKGFVFDGNGDYVNLGDGVYSGEFTISAWAKANSRIGLYDTIIGSGDLGIGLILNGDSKWAFFGYLATGNPATSNSVVNFGSWYHLIGVYDSSGNMSLYVNGVLQDDGANSSSFPSNYYDSLDIGMGSGGSTYPFNGTIDDVMLFNRSLSANEIAALYANQTSKYLEKNFTSLSDGPHTIKAYTQDEAGNVNSTESRTVTVDTTPPSINFTTPTPKNPANQSETYVTINVSIVETSLGQIKYDWNNTNFTYYNDSLVLMFNFDNKTALNETTTPANNQTTDVSIYGNNGTFMGDATINLTGGKYGGGLLLDGTGDYVSVPNHNSLNITQEITISAWIKAKTWETQNWEGTIVGKDSWEDGDSHGYVLRTGDSGRLTLVISNVSSAAWPFAMTDQLMSTGVWYHIAGTFNGTHIKAFINGEVKQTTIIAGTTMETSVYPVEIGRSPYDNTRIFDGTIDEVRIWNRSLSAAEIYQEYASNLNKFNQTQWYLYINQSLNATDTLTDGTYTYQAHASDKLDNWNTTEQRTITIDATPPAWQNNNTNLTEDDRIDYGRWFYINWSDDLGLNSYIFSWNGTGSWVNNTPIRMTGTVNESNVTKTIGLTQGNTIGWRVYANDSVGNWNSTDIFTFLVNNTPPVRINLSYPHNNTIITNTTPRFNWTNSTDADNDTLYYDIFIRCLGGCSIDNRIIYNLTNANYTPSPPLKYYQDDGYSYEWWVRPFDNISYGLNSSISNFTIASSVIISLPTANVSFGELTINQQNDTTDDNPPPIIIQNDGNSYININITIGSYLWTSVQSESSYLQYKIDNVTGEENAFNSTLSAVSWTNFTITNSTGIYKLNYSDDRDSAEVDINISVPPNEPPGNKQSNILFTGYYLVVT